MVTLKLKPWVIIDNLDHVATSWQVATDKEFTNVIDEVLEDNEKLILYMSPVLVPVGVQYWIRAKRHLANIDDGVVLDTDWLLPKPVINTDTTSSLVLVNDIKIEQPMVYINKNEILDKESDVFTIRTSKFRGTGDGHYATHWFIRDYENKIIFSSLYDTTNLESIDINKIENSIIDKNIITISAIHVTATSIESPIGEVTINLFNTNFEINSNLTRVFPETDYTLQFKKLDENKDIGIVKVEVLDGTRSKSLWYKLINTEIDSIVINGEVLKQDSIYIIDVHITDEEDNIIIKRKELKTLSNVIDDRIDFNYVPKKEIKYLYELSIPKLPAGYSSKEIYDTIVPVWTNEGNTVSKFKFDRVENKLIDTNTVFNGVSLLNNNNDYTFIKYTNNNKIVIDTLDSSGIPTFLVYEYNLYFNTSVLLQTIPRIDETIPIGKTNNIIFLDNDSFYYVPVNGNTIKKVNLSTGENVDVAIIPVTTTEVTMFNMGRNRFFIYPGEGGIGYSFNIELETFIESFTIPVIFRDRGLRSTRLINGDVVIYRNEYVLSDGINNNLIYYSYSEGEIIDITYEAAEGIGLDGSLELLSGEVMLIDSSGTHDRYFEFK